MKLVVDTSVILKWFVHTEDDFEEALWYSFVSEDLIAPDLVCAEISSALSKKVARNEIGDAQARAALESLSSYFSELTPSSELSLAAYEIARTLSHAVYDCFFLAVALKGDGRQLLTADRDFIRKVVGKGFGEYTRPIGRRDVSVDALAKPSESFESLAKAISEVESHLVRQLQGSAIPLLTESICNLPEFETANERSWFREFKKSLSNADPEVLRKVISVCWYGRPLAPDSYKQMHHDSGELTNDPERHAFYIASLLPYFKGGIERLKALN